MFKNILFAVAIVLALAITVVLVLATTKPDEFTVQRSATLDAPAEAVFGLVNDFRRWPEWSPWEDRDPEMTREFSGAPQGAGAVYAWDGNRDAGAGRMEILDSRPNEHLRIQLEFVRPMESTSTTTIDFQPRGQQTHVTWTMRGANPYPFKVMQVFVDMDSLLGGDFELGLVQLEAAAAREPVAGPVDVPTPEYVDDELESGE